MMFPVATTVAALDIELREDEEAVYAVEPDSWLDLAMPTEDIFGMKGDKTFFLNRGAWAVTPAPSGRCESERKTELGAASPSG